MYEVCSQLFSLIPLQCGELDTARVILGRAITLEPDSGHSKYLSMAQLLSGKEALGMYKKGLEIIQEEKGSKRELSNAFCAVAELYMTDLCDEVWPM